MSISPNTRSHAIQSTLMAFSEAMHHLAGQSLEAFHASKRGDHALALGTLLDAPDRLNEAQALLQVAILLLRRDWP
ncbi:MAG: hypothetical protein EKK47_16630 [Burkholderiales bacterium]|nr:MAG: hypothetical protein EKK47_16630 [Burkholderiales bacterium]